MSAPAGFIVGLAQIALPDLYVAYLSRRPRFKILLLDVTPDKVERQITLWAFHESRSQALKCSLMNLSASIAALQPSAAAVTACRYLKSLTTPAANIPGTLVSVSFLVTM